MRLCVLLYKKIFEDFCSKEKRMGEVVLSSLHGKYSVQNLEGKGKIVIFAALNYK